MKSCVGLIQITDWRVKYWEIKKLDVLLYLWSHFDKNLYVDIIVKSTFFFTLHYILLCHLSSNQPYVICLLLFFLFQWDSYPRTIVEAFTLLLSPYAPHLAEELWSRLGHSESLAYEPFPKVWTSFPSSLPWILAYFVYTVEQF